VAAGVHFAGNLGFVRRVVGFKDGQGVHVGANANDGTITIA
jgi:hypothetical protein